MAFGQNQHTNTSRDKVSELQRLKQAISREKKNHSKQLTKINRKHLMNIFFIMLLKINI